METLEAIRARRAVRSYRDEPVEEAVLDKILDAGLWAPSGMGAQSQKLLLVTDEALKGRLSKLNAAIMGKEIDPFYGAPAIVFVLCDATAVTATYDGPLAAENMMLAATSLGVGSCYVFRGREMFATAEGKQILEDLGLGGNLEGSSIVLLGYPKDEMPAPAPRNGNRIFKA